MGKLIAWLILIFVVLLALRVITARNKRAAQSGPSSGASAGAPPKIEPMVRCTRCGIYLPRDETVEVAGGVVCADQNCLKR